jgi:hypothetical protein
MAKKKQEEVEMTTETTMDITMVTPSDAKEMSDETVKSEQERYNKMANEFGELLKVKKYGVQFDNIKDGKSLLKHFEKNVKWTHADAPLFIAAYQKLKAAVEIGLNESSQLEIDGPALNAMYQLLLKTEGTGFFEVRDYMTLLTNVGEGISNAMRLMVEDQNTLKNIHSTLSVLDDETNARSLGIQVEAEPVAETEQTA